MALELFLKGAMVCGRVVRQRIRASGRVTSYWCQPVWPDLVGVGKAGAWKDAEVIKDVQGLSPRIAGRGDVADSMLGVAEMRQADTVQRVGRLVPVADLS